MLHNGKTSLITDLFRGRAGRRKVRDRLGAARLATQWRGRSRDTARESVGIALVEHMGDIVAAEPVIAPLRERHPEAELTWVVRSSYRDLVAHHPLIDSLLEVRSLGEWLMLQPKRPFDVLYDLHVTGREDPVTHARVQRTGAGGEVDATNYYEHGTLLENACRYAGLEPLDVSPTLHLPPKVWDRVHTLALPERFGVIHARSNQPSRDWEDAKWPQLVRRLHGGLGLTCVEVGLRSVVSGGEAGYVDLCGKLSVVETAEVIRRASLFIGIDSGPAHLANAARTPGVILMGQYASYEQHMPFSGGYRDSSTGTVLRATGPASQLSVDEVFAAAVTRVADEVTR